MVGIPAVDDLTLCRGKTAMDAKCLCSHGVFSAEGSALFLCLFCCTDSFLCPADPDRFYCTAVS